MSTAGLDLRAARLFVLLFSNVIINIINGKASKEEKLEIGKNRTDLPHLHDQPHQCTSHIHLVQSSHLRTRLLLSMSFQMGKGTPFVYAAQGHLSQLQAERPQDII